ncbi:hypothetical protein QUF72_09395 [Desulfobacterales bacterium HSG2]|nr:hypothetical protein [Desulfobacterales bacterium HSG2]
MEKEKLAMQELTKAQKSRNAIKIFQTMADALALRGYYKPSGQSGQTLKDALRMLSPEIYGTMNDPRTTELKGLEYVIDRLPRGIEECSRIVLTAQEYLEDTSFEKIEPLRRRRTSYRVSDKDICFVITRGLSEIYDILTHITFLVIEAKKIRNQMRVREWDDLEKTVTNHQELDGSELDRAIWNLSIILGRTYQETKETYAYLEKNRKEANSNRGLFQIIHSLGKRMQEEETSKENELLIYFTPSLRDMIGHHRYAQKWAVAIKEKLCGLGLQDRPIHIISANMHSVMNTLYGYASGACDQEVTCEDFFLMIRDRTDEVKAYAKEYGLYEIPDKSGAHIDCQVIDTALLKSVSFHPELGVEMSVPESEKPPVILVMDYAFGTQAFEVMDELLGPFETEDSLLKFNIESISVMGKAGILPGKKGDIMLASAHVLEGTPHNYIVHNDLKKEDFDTDVYEGVIVTVLGTSLQNRDVLRRFQTTSWKAVGLEMEGGHYQRAINAAIIREHISGNVKVRYAYYASDNPLMSGQTLASGSMGTEGIPSTYMITRVILEKILSSS